MSMFKKCKVVMLPSESQSTVFLKSNNFLEYNIHPPLHGINDLGWKYQHLYVLSDDEIKVGDWCVQFTIRGHAENVVRFGKNDTGTFRKKVIATTDMLKIGDGTADSPYRYLSHPSEQFIKQYVEAYNNGKPIEEVEVEYELCETYKMDECNSRFHCCENPTILKINFDNTINIKLVKDTWTREEVIEFGKLILDTFHSEGLTKSGEQRLPRIKYDNWIKENI